MRFLCTRLLSLLGMMAAGTYTRNVRDRLEKYRHRTQNIRVQK